MAQGYFVYKKDTFATFDLFVRELPENRAYLVFCGLEDILDYLKGLKFDKDDIDYLKKQKLFSPDFLKYLAGFKFSGDVWAMPEGTVFFNHEPVIRITAPIIEAQIIESFLLNTVNLQTMIASKASRVIYAAKDKGVYDFSLRRTHGSEAGIKVGRATYIAGARGTSNVLAGKLYKIPIAGTMAHSFVMSFRQEMDSFLAYANTFPRATTLLVDTYDTKKGIENAVTLGLYLKEQGYFLQGIRLDSGDIAALSKLARKMLDAAGLGFVKIFASGNLDEFKIKELLKEGAMVDNFGVGTNMGTSIDAPCLDVVYKLSEVTGEDGKFCPVMKLSKGKITYPGRKQVFRARGRSGKFTKDIIGLEKEKINGKRLLIKVMEKGKLVYKPPSLEKIRKVLKDNFSGFPDGIKDTASRCSYTVAISPGLKKLSRDLSCQLTKRQ